MHGLDSLCGSAIPSLVFVLLKMEKHLLHCQYAAGGIDIVHKRQQSRQFVAFVSFCPHSLAPASSVFSFTILKSCTVLPESPGGPQTSAKDPGPPGRAVLGPAHLYFKEASLRQPYFKNTCGFDLVKAILQALTAIHISLALLTLQKIIGRYFIIEKLLM